ncbi:putative Tubulin--tyrosine ligase-like protein [Naja naja]|nr:putative Tubulin--tyrosine ligase-like protein [Naja naja]
MAAGDNDAYLDFVALHRPALSASAVPQRYWPSLWRKLENEVFDAGEYFGIMQVEEADEQRGNEETEEELKMKSNLANELCYKVIVTNENGLQASSCDSIFLIDHAWTYRVEHARQQLMQVPGLLHRMANLMGIDFHGEVPDEAVVNQVLEEMWKYNQTYQLSCGTAEEKVPVWYIMDEFGSRIQHSDEPTFATAPLFYMPQQIAFTILWPLRDLENGVGYKAILTGNKEKLPASIKLPIYEKNKIFKYVFPNSLHRSPAGASELESPRFEFTDLEQEADILYIFSHFKDYRKLSEEKPHVMLNQFPCENLLTVKDCLASISRRVGDSEGPKWLPHTFNLCTELPQFISFFQQCESRGKDNHWICKPWNLARSLDTHITKNLNNIIRQRESIPKVVSKYIENPVLFHLEDVGLVKFDVRYIVLLRSVNPLKLYVYDVFWLRFSNRPFSLDDLDDYEKHFTVMNYAPEISLKQIHYNEFIPLFEKQYSEYSWKTVEEDIFKAFVELFHAACAKPAPLGLCDYPSSRAVYAIDLMLKWESSGDGKQHMQPQILEVNFNPDCERACKYHPTFFNDVFCTLFLDEPNNCHVTSIV